MSSLPSIATSRPATGSWVVLVVDDDPSVLRLTQLVFSTLELEGRPLRIITATSGSEARAVLEQRSDVAVALVDVVMETETAGPDLVRWMRTRDALADVRIIIRSGQPGRSTSDALWEALGIHDYWSKTAISVAESRARLGRQIRAYAEHARRVGRDTGTRWCLTADHPAAIWTTATEALLSLGASICATTTGTPAVVFGREGLPPAPILTSALARAGAVRWVLGPGRLEAWPSRFTVEVEAVPVVHRPAGTLLLSPHAAKLFAGHPCEAAAGAPGWTWTHTGDVPGPLSLRALAYTSRYAGTALIADLAAILRCADPNNVFDGLTGLMVVDEGRFVQYLEGPEHAVRATFARIWADPRHTDVTVILDTPVDRRLTPDGPMDVLQPAGGPMPPQLQPPNPSLDRTPAAFLDAIHRWARPAVTVHLPELPRAGALDG